MCGIIGYVGNRDAQDILTGGLRRLEYRGYDSAGIVTADSKGKVTLLRAKGKVAELDAKVQAHANDDHVGIGHTRWATHGVPSERNAHPHHVGAIYMVHNGIIENYRDLKELLGGKGYTFNSDTDTEVLTALVDSFYKAQETKNLLMAVSEALQMAVGAYGIAVLAADAPNELIVARKGSPLVIGVSEGEVYIASDPSALIGHTDQVIYLKDGEIASCRTKGVELFDIATNSVEKVIEKLELDLQAIQKKGFDHFLLKEIHEQPETLRSTLSGRVQLEGMYAKLGGLNMSDKQLSEIEHILIVGCGTAHYAGVLASYYIEQISDKVTVQVAIASELRYRSFNLPKNTVALVVSQSGETADTHACLRELQKRGIRCLGIVNAVGSTIAREVDGGVYVHVGAEISVASTKAFTSQVAAMLLFGLVVAQAKGAGKQSIGAYLQELDALPDEISKLIETHSDEMKKLAGKYAKYEHALFMGRDTLFPVALEGALKLKEISYIQAEGCAAGELKHGPIALVDDRFFEVAMVADNLLYEKGISNLVEINARGGHVIALTDSDKPIDAEAVVRISSHLNLLTPLLFNVLLQLFAYHVAVARGNDVDQPRNLAKSVTVE